MTPGKQKKMYQRKAKTNRKYKKIKLKNNTVLLR